jgi:hypothetical protein
MADKKSLSKRILKRELGSIKKGAEKASKKIRRITSEGPKFSKAKILKKPKAKGPRPISAKKTLQSFAKSKGPVVGEPEEKVIVQDNRSQFFKREKEKEQKWLS